MELVQVHKETKVNNVSVIPEIIDKTEYYSPLPVQVSSVKKEYNLSPFIEANTNEVSLRELKTDCIIPVFKDNERTISHQEFIEVTLNAVNTVFNHHNVDNPEIRVSHQIKGRIPEAIHKSAKELLDHEKTQYFERMAFAIRIPSITETINGQELALIVGGVRAYNRENLYSKKSFEKFQVFIGFQNMVCCNLCVSTDGYKAEIRVSSYSELQTQILDLFRSYNAEKHIKSMKFLSQQTMTETQFAQMIGKARLYNYLPKDEKLNIPKLTLIDNQISTIAKDYYQDDSFSRNTDGTINMWNVYNLFTGANKGSYIDSFLSRNVNAFDFSNGLAETLNGGNSHHWFLS